jgi:large subunit ribosomal protein L18Ae
MPGFKLYQVIGRKAPTAAEPDPPVYRMKLFAPNEVLARSRFWYYMHQYRKMKKTTGEVLDVNEIREKNDRVVKTYYVMLRYNSRSGTHNMYREYRATKLTGAVDQLYSEMAGRHRARPRSIQIIRTGVVENKADLKRPATIQYAKDRLKFPLPHRIVRAPEKKFKSTFAASRPSTHFQ